METFPVNNTEVKSRKKIQQIGNSTKHKEIRKIEADYYQNGSWKWKALVLEMGSSFTVWNRISGSLELLDRNDKRNVNLDVD